jgi:hypothetical protein
MTSLYFEENQKFREIAFFILIGLIQAIFLWGLTQQVIFHKPWGPEPLSDNSLLIVNLGLLGILLLFNSIKLKTVITDQQIAIKMFPVPIKERIIEWSEVKDISVIKYDGIKEYNGYGARYSSKKGWRYTISGPYAIKLTLTDGKKILIGTHRPEEISQIIDNLKTRGIIIP